jgi:predicted nucleic acid-binding protein
VKAFIDTSSLAKRYIQEPGSEELEEFFLAAVGEVYISTLAIVEFSAAIGRKVRNKDIMEKAGANAMQEFELDWQGCFTKVPLTEELAELASSLAIQHPLKGSDAVHLSSAAASGADLFVTSDMNLLKAAKKIGIQSYNPVDGIYSR